MCPFCVNLQLPEFLNGVANDFCVFDTVLSLNVDIFYRFLKVLTVCSVNDRCHLMLI